MAVDPATRAAYVTNSGSDSVSVIDEATRRAGWEWEHRPATAWCRALPGAACWDVRLCADSEDSPMMAVLRDVVGCEVCEPSVSSAGAQLADGVKGGVC